MNKECNVVKDLIPLYIEEMLRDDSREFVELHIKNCKDCAKFIEDMKISSVLPNYNYYEDAVPLKKAKKKFINRIILLITMVVVITLIIGFFFGSRVIEIPYTESKINEWERDTFDKEEMAALEHSPSEEEFNIANDIIDQAQEVFADYMYTREECENLYGALARYSYGDRDGLEYVTFSIDMLGCQVIGDRGFVWVNYSHAGYMNHETVTGSWDVNSCWHIEKTADGKWKVVSITEHP